jgi:hypothetical protein
MAGPWSPEFGFDRWRGTYRWLARKGSSRSGGAALDGAVREIGVKLE